mmetsp:Transcript_17100/g.42875  ORF Transcript_17100/g.42875 Transcript_17100/m.42875 type:complete len:270 (+) Transcript_17100:1933-2742(+)
MARHGAGDALGEQRQRHRVAAHVARLVAGRLPARVAADPRVLQQLGDGGAQGGLAHQHGAHEVHGVTRQVRRVLHLLGADEVQRLLGVGRGKGRAAGEQLVREHAHAPAVHLGGVADGGVLLVVGGVLLDGAVQDLGGQVVDGAQPRVGHLVLGVDGQPKVGDLDLEGVVEQDVLGLDVSVRDAVGVQVVDDEQEGVQHQLHRRALRQPPAIPVQQREQIARVRKLLHQHHLVRLLEGAKEADDVLVAQARVQLDLTEDLESVEVTQVA